MKLRKTLKLFSAITFLALGCCFSAFATRETFKVGEKDIATYEFIDGTEKGVNKILVVHRHFEDPKQADRLMFEFAYFIRQKCRREKINLQAVGTPHLVYEVTKDKDLRIQARSVGKDFTVREWALAALNCINDTTYERTVMSKPHTAITRTPNGFVVRENVVDVLTSSTTWGRPIRNVIIVSGNIEPRTYYDLSDQYGENISTMATGRAWSHLFGIDGRCKCQKFILNGKEMHPRDIVKQAN